MNDADIRHKVLQTAIDYHSRSYGHGGFNAQYVRMENRPPAEVIVETAEKFLGFVLIEKGTQEVRAKRRGR